MAGAAVVCSGGVAGCPRRGGGGRRWLYRRLEPGETSPFRYRYLAYTKGLAESKKILSCNLLYSRLLGLLVREGDKCVIAHNG